ncbi:MAG: histidine phosphatase family protein [Candidatus Sulfomarinibacteraceae bacterium]
MKPARSTRLILVRHGEVDANRNFAYLGRRDDRLNANGLAQARALADAFTGIHVDRVVSSPLQRALATAGAIAESAGAPLDTDRRLIELDFGSWEGRSRAEVVGSGEHERRAVERWEADPSLRTPGGESLLELQERVVGWANETAGDGEGQTVLMVSHMGPVKTLLCAALGVPLTSARRIFLDPATVSVVDWGATPVVRLVNSHAHLGFSRARWLDPP